MKTSESGRTLIEMMGVLALMGLFTVASISLYRNAVTKMRVNDLLDNVRNRALVSSKNSSKMTYGMYDQKSGGASPVTAYGFGVADNKTGVKRDVIDGHAVALVPVGAINGGHALDKGTCNALLDKIYDGKKGDKPMVGSVIEVFEEKCKNVLEVCGSDDEEYPEPVPDIICIAIKS